MRRCLARLAWGLPVIWDAEAEPPQLVTVKATVVHVIHSLPEPEDPARVIEVRRFGAGKGN